MENQCIFQPVIEPSPATEIKLQPCKTSVSKKRHSQMIPEDLSMRWGISLAQLALTLKATTRNFVRSLIMPMSRRYIVDQMFMVNRLQCKIATSILCGRCKSIYGHR